MAMAGLDPAAAIDVRDAGVTFSSRVGNIDAFTGVSLRASAGEFVSLVGPSGCGKTTLLRACAGLIQVSRGHVFVLGSEVRSPTGAVGLVFQRPALMPWRTVLANVLLPSEVLHRPIDEARNSARTLLKLVGLDGFELNHPYELSGGMQQRVALCRALIHDPDVLLMDEPFGALDALTRENMNLELQRIWMERSKTVLFVTHSINEAVFLSDRVIVMSQRPGRILGEVTVRAERPRRLGGLAMPALAEAAEKVRMMLGDSGASGGTLE